MDVPIIVLLPGERLLWSGRPQRIAPTGLEWFRIVFGSVLVAAFAIAVPFADGRISFFGVFVVLFGLAIVCGPVAFRLWTTHRAVYAVTDQRVVVADRISGHTRKWMEVTSPVITSLRGAGAGTLTFHPLLETVDILGFGLPKQNQPRPIALFAVPDVKKVYGLIVRALD